MDPKHTSDMLKHLEKQNELLTNSKSLIFEELHKLQVEEDMLMRKFFELMTAHGNIQKKDDGSVIMNNSGLGESTAAANDTCKKQYSRRSKLAASST